MLQLRELLILFTDASLPARSSGVLDHGKSHLHHAGNRRSAPSGESNILPDLLDILTCIEAVMAIPDFEPHVPVFASPADKKAGKQGKLSEEIVMLFRNLWFVATVLGLSNQSSKETRPHRNLLKSIAVKTPCLLYGTPLNYVDTELEYNPLLRKEHGQVRSSLSLKKRRHLLILISHQRSLPNIYVPSSVLSCHLRVVISPLVPFPTRRWSSSLRSLFWSRCVPSWAILHRSCTTSTTRVSTTVS